MPRVYHAPLILGAFAKNLPPARVVFEQIPERMIRLPILQAAEALDGRAGISAIEKLQALGCLAGGIERLRPHRYGAANQSAEEGKDTGAHPQQKAVHARESSAAAATPARGLRAAPGNQPSDAAVNM